jgi:hypothetical protein
VPDWRPLLLFVVIVDFLVDEDGAASLRVGDWENVKRTQVAPKCIRVMEEALLRLPE